MKKICFVIMGNIYMIPYISLYTKHFDCPYSVIYWDREGAEENPDSNTFFKFSKKMDNKNIIQKIVGFFQFRRYARSVLRENDFDVVILLQTWCAIILSSVLRKKYYNKFIVDVRDYTYENNPIINLIETKTFNKALAVVISSEGYKEFLPKREYYVAHNMRKLDDDTVQAIKNRQKIRETLNIAFIGFVNYQEQHKRLIDKLGNDPRFKLSFIGTRAVELSEYCERNHINNVTLVDTFDSKKILDFYKDVDLVNNLYGNHTPTLDFALSNKLYFAAELCIPILVCPDTYMQKVSCEYGFGYTVDLEDSNIADKIWNFYQTINWSAFDVSCERFLEKAKAKQYDLECYLEKILN